MNGWPFVHKEYPGVQSPDTKASAPVQRHILMDTLLLTCHFLFEQKQLSLQSPCSGMLWVLLTGSDLFTQPRDKVGLQAHPGATVTTATFLSHTTLPASPRTRWCCWQSPLSTPQYRRRCVWSSMCSGSWPRPH